MWCQTIFRGNKAPVDAGPGHRPNIRTPAARLQTSCLCPSFHPPKIPLCLHWGKSVWHTHTHTHWAQLALSVETCPPHWSSVLLTNATAKSQEVAFYRCMYVAGLFRRSAAEGLIEGLSAKTALADARVKVCRCRCAPKLRGRTHRTLFCMLHHQLTLLHILSHFSTEGGWSRRAGLNFGVLTGTEVSSHCGDTVRSLWKLSLFRCRLCAVMDYYSWERDHPGRRQQRGFILPVGADSFHFLSYYLISHDVGLETTSAGW